ncbi:MAG: dCTP deaminase [Waterburya sp.]
MLNDRQIIEMVEKYQTISPFQPNLISKIGEKKVISYGLSSFGYDIRLSDVEFAIFDHQACFRSPIIDVDPKDFDREKITETIQLQEDYFLLPPLTYALGVSLERIKMPPDTIANVLGKSTYARAGLIVNVTPLEPCWEGHITLEFFNAGRLPLRLYPNEGIAQIQFFQGEKPIINYQDRGGKYQNQECKIVEPKV